MTSNKKCILELASKESSEEAGKNQWSKTITN